MRTPHRALEKFRGEIDMAISLADEAFSIEPDYLPASDLVVAG